MDALVSTIGQYVDFLILGAVALLIWSIPFTLHDPITRSWTFLLEKCFPAGAPHDRYSKFISVGLAGGLLFAIFYFSGYMLNAFGHYLLQDGHYAVIHESSFIYTPDNTQELRPKADLYRRTFGFGEKPSPAELESYRQDSIRQMRWQICDKVSYEEAFSGTLLKQLRMTRGGVAILFLLTILGVMALALNLYANRGRRWKQFAWPIGSLIVAGLVYWFVLMPMWRNAEHEAHGINWAVYPPGEKMTALPCTEEFQHAVRNNVMLSKQPSSKDDASSKKSK